MMRHAGHAIGELSRHHFGFRAVLYRLKAKFNLQAIAKEEMKATGWGHNLLWVPSLHASQRP
jgi:hypothetical protein